MMSDESYEPDEAEHEAQVAHVTHMVSGWLQNMARDALGQNKVLSAEAISEALGAMSDEWAGMQTAVFDDEALKRLLEGE